MKKPLVIITGPTAVGKTGLSIDFCKRINGSIVSCDSMQVYKMLDIGSAKIAPEEMEGIPHYLIDVLDPKENFNVAEFKDMATAAVNDIYDKGRIPVLCGGTGFYIQAFLYDVDFSEACEDEAYRESLLLVAKELGKEKLHEQLATVDPKSAESIHPNNLKRMIRALEYYHQTGKRISDHNENAHKKDSPYNFLYFVINEERSKLYERVDKRVDIMFENGLLGEIKSLKKYGCTAEMTSMQGIGYKEPLTVIDTDFDEILLKDKIKQNTRHFAKRQLTWFRREKETEWINKEEFGYSDEAMIEYMIKRAKEKGIC